MSRISGIAIAVTVLGLCIGTTSSQSVAPKDEPGKWPDLGFDYRTLIKDHQTLINTGAAEKAAEFLAAKTKQGKAANQALSEALTKKFSLIYGGSGKQDGVEFMGYRQISPRCIVFYVVGHYENSLIQFSYGFERWKGEWKLHHFGMVDDMGEIARNVPFIRITAK